MVIARKFNRPAAAPAKRRSRFAGIKESLPRDPAPSVGSYLYAIRSCEEGVKVAGKKMWAKLTLEVMQADEKSGDAVEDIVGTQFCLDTSAGLSDLKRFVRTALGFEDEAEYDAWDPEGESIDAALGEVNQYAPNGNPVIGRFIWADVIRGNATPDGQDFYRRFDWFVVPEADQEVKSIAQE